MGIACVANYLPLNVRYLIIICIFVDANAYKPNAYE